ncbi:MAG: efflux RND transporter periplasmic adaptor subunit [Bacteroidia bacterium]|nr:efflux RND transporter periplasmic adaptor subunit [Bacteroidia bacterium]
MKPIIAYIIFISFWSCSDRKSLNTEYPPGLPEKKQLLAEKKQEMKSLEELILRLEEDISESEPKVQELKKITTSRILPQDIKRFVEIQGSIAADDIVMASSEIGGRITRVYVKEGDYVRRGSRIAIVDMQSMRKQVEEVEKSLELAVEVFTRQERLWKQNIGSEIQYLQSKNDKERLEKSLETLGFNLTKANIYAPISGVVDQSFLKSGEMASPGAPIVQILNTSKVKVSIDVPEKYLKAVKKGNKIHIEIPTLEYEKDVRITDIGRMIDPGNRTFNVEAAISNEGGRIKPNLMVIAYLPDYEAKDVIAISSELVQQEINGSNYVFVVDQDSSGKMIAQKRYIQIGESVENELVITEGLADGDELIIDGSRMVNDQQEVEIMNENIDG